MKFNVITLKIKLEEYTPNRYKEDIIEYIGSYLPGAVQYKEEVDSEVESVMIDSIYFDFIDE